MNMENNKILFIRSSDYCVDFNVTGFIKTLIEFGLKRSFLELNKSKHNYFYNEETKKKIEFYYYKNLRIYKIFIRFILKLKKIIRPLISPINTDLSLTKLSNFNQKDILIIHQNSAEWKFLKSDMIKIWSNALLNTDYLFPIPTIPKNPYLNKKFSKANLLKIYSNIQEKKLPLEIILFANSNFNITKMTTIHWNYFIERSYHQEVINMTNDEFDDKLKYILSEYLPKIYSWKHIKNDKNHRRIFHNSIVNFIKYENIVTQQNSLVLYRKKLRNILENNHTYLKRNHFEITKFKKMKNHKEFLKYFSNNKDFRVHYHQNQIFKFGDTTVNVHENNPFKREINDDRANPLSECSYANEVGICAQAHNVAIGNSERSENEIKNILNEIISSIEIESYKIKNRSELIALPTHINRKKLDSCQYNNINKLIVNKEILTLVVDKLILQTENTNKKRPRNHEHFKFKGKLEFSIGTNDINDYHQRKKIHDFISKKKKKVKRKFKNNIHSFVI